MTNQEKTNHQELKHELKKVYESKIIRKVLKVCVVILAALVIFQAGQFVGLKRAEFSFRMADNYYNNFGSRLDHRSMMGGVGQGPSILGRNMMGGGDFTESHGASGKIIRINLPTVTVSTPENIEKTILINKETVIREFRDSIKATDLKVDDIVVVIGDPTDQGQVEAKFIRVMPYQMMSPGITIVATSTAK
ncbi:MAG: hypothetical protein WCG97_00100 [bacterium]